MTDSIRDSDTVLVTGGAGYIGSHAVLALREAGLDCVVLDNLTTGFREAVPAEVPLVVGDIADRDLVARTCRTHAVTAILHFAASVVVPESVADPLKYYANNVGGSIGLFAGAVAGGVRRLVFSSTAAVYGEPETVPVAETAPLLPVNPYGASKLMVERILADTAAAHGLDYLILRYFNVAGADPLGRAGQRTRGATHLIKVACEVAAGRRPMLDIFGSDYPTADGTCIRDYIHVSDLADAHVLALRYLARGGTARVLNCGYGRGYSVREVADAVSRVIGRPLPTRLAGRRAGDPARIVAAADAIRTELGWTPRHADLDGIVHSAYRWESRGALAA
jgi:UDP-glucose 4-epimerase